MTEKFHSLPCWNIIEQEKFWKAIAVPYFQAMRLTYTMKHDTQIHTVSMVKLDKRLV